LEGNKHTEKVKEDTMKNHGCHGYQEKWNDNLTEINREESFTPVSVKPHPT